ncbi:ankyrin repeat protein, putative [Trichomonas vaginalis G3]|uniref:Ankyrin repeat protein, putative n=1 Tax=Trichomonas vaginalis (strain ATCC PRA-98 / G3) TaxID=412133 RepID=A2F1E2_TRIV3|nr:spectrin binding [Trichomonas vaginalis G3]EAY01306.1 ankyrin repeat protein, putative [Trichomonas vaginalis G3]KAI5542836.1 spectrin binding [Trichomonas vaginalis G3]|eukprot:XP_001330174.1 ankyrin repeat protein [Trichomonas vaginalis G3]
MSVLNQETFMQMFEATEKGDINTLKMMITPPITVDTILDDIYVLDGRCTRKPTLLIIAASFSQTQILEYLLSKGANPNIADKRNRYPLHFAAMKGDIDIVRALIGAKADVNKQDWDDYSPLHYCAQNGFISGAKALLDEGAQINIQTRLKESPLIIAIQNGQTEMVDFLIQSHADVSLPALHNQYPLFFVSDGVTAELLIKAGANVNSTDENNQTPLHHAAQDGYLDVVEILLKSGAKVNATDNQKQTPLHIAAGNGQVDVCKALLDAGAEVKALDIGRRSPEMLARRNDHIAVTSLIAQYQDDDQDDDVPVIGFKAFTGIKHTATPPPGSEAGLTPDDLKFDILESL